MTRKAKPPIAIYSALADATRCRIVEILLAGPIPVHTLADAFSISRPAISRHLRVLKTAGLVAEVKKGRENLYALRPSKLGAATNWIAAITAPAMPDSQHLSNEPLPAAEAAPTRPVLPPVAGEIEESPGAAELVVSPKPEKAARAVRIAKPEPTLNQMGFDF